MKIQRAAEKAGKTPRQFVDEMSTKFKELCKVLNISYDRFIRTTEKEHEELSRNIFDAVYKKGDIYKGTYEGLYCVDCESFYTQKDAPGFKCPVHKKALDKVKEESYFFRLQKYENKILEYIQKNKFIVPQYRANEITNRLKEGLRDLSVSRTSFKWGIKVPFDDKHVIYVWYDALINYLSGVDYELGKDNKYWPANIHLIGKDILWHHSVIWPAMLYSAKIELPKQILVHGFINIKGEKLSKSAGRIIDPIALAEKYGADVLRYYLIKDIPFGEDGNFSEQVLKDRNNELADKLGNLVSRLEGLAERLGEIKKANADIKLTGKLKLKEIQNRMEKFEFDKALSLIIDFVDACNAYVQEKKPWEIEDRERLNGILYTLFDSLRVIALLLHPFIPSTSEEILSRLNGKGKLLASQLKFNLITKVKIKRGKGVLFQKLSRL